MPNIFIILPIHLINPKLIPRKCKIIMIEDPIYFGYRQNNLNFNKLKLVLHRASMKYYQVLLKSKGYKVKYIDFKDILRFGRNKYLKDYDQVFMFDPVDHLVLKEYKKSCDELIVYDSPIFIDTLDDLDEYEQLRKKKGHKKYYHSSFYTWQRKKLNILVGSKTYDTQNRESLPQNIKIPKLPKGDQNTKYVREAQRYINKHFPNNYGDTKYFMYPITHKTSKVWLRNFINTRLPLFGTYQDAISTRGDFLFHSILSPMINIGLLTPREVINEVTKAYYANSRKIKINNYEGFIRQVIGWREYQRYLYEFAYKQMVSRNFFGNTRKLSKKWYQGTTGVLPIDHAIQTAFKYGYLHHIQRLMIMSNFMNLCGISPKEAYKWFMEFAIDSYDWVMIGNVYSMGMFADGGLSMRKPYISSSSYILRMSDYPRDNWTKVWDLLYRAFWTKHAAKLKRYYGLGRPTLLKSQKDRDLAKQILKKI